MLSEIGDVPHCDSANCQRFLVGRRELFGKLLNVARKCSPTVRCQIMIIEELSENDGFILGDRDTCENIISRILAFF